MSAWQTLDRDILRLVPPRPADANKYSFGRLQIVAGSRKYPGAAFLCALGAFKAGCGYVALESFAAAEVLAKIPEVVLAHDEKATALVVGPGLPLDESARWRGHLEAKLPKLIDASALALLTAPELARFERTVFTPHSAEAARIFGLAAEDVDGNPASTEARVRFLENHVAPRLHASSTFLLKGRETLILHKSAIRLVPTGSVAQANAGQGDLLSGVIGALLAQGLDGFEAAQLGAYSLGLAADRLSQGLYPAGVLAHQVAEELPRLWAEVEKKQK
jgi:hydroxyethylthiazole kinase-like uncharacterized protein yjeF